MDRLRSRRASGAVLHTAIQELAQAIELSAAEVQRLRQLPLRLEYDPALPIVAHREQIAEAMQRHPLIVVCGATGSGKTTQLPKICLEAGRGSFGLIGHTQPRRIAARAIAARLASELGTSVGGAVGYQVRFTDRSGPDCRVKLMTDGILLRELANDRLLRRYDTLIIDEAHERSLNIDFLLGVLRRLLPQRPELRVIITSATIDPQRFAEFFGGAPIIEVSGRSYPVEVRYRPLASEEDDSELSLSEGIVAAVRELDRQDRGDVLVFLPGERQIRDAAEVLGKAALHHTEVLPLYARLSTRDQERIFEPHGPRRIVLATNVAETSLTVPGIRHVVDSGLARISRYSVRGKVQRLPIEPISQASAEQRKGRAGRERAGICVRLYAQDDFDLRAPFTAPEVLRTNLASVILQMAALDLGEPQAFPFLDPPDTRMINDGYRLLQELKAVDDARAVTSLGRQLSALPLDPRLARMLIAASHHRCLSEMLIIAAFLAAQDPRERPTEAQTQADQKHATFADPRSDFVTVLNLWQTFSEQSAALSGSQLRRWCRENFLSFLRLREWQELRRQLQETTRELKLPLNQAAADYTDLHQAVLTGFLGGIGVLDERREYEGARGARFVIAPGTPLASKPPKWVVAASLMETTRLYARMVAAIEPQWIEAAGAHLLKRSYSEPHWIPERGFVAAFESTALYGLILSARRRVNYGSVAPREAREIFVREALVEGHTRLRAPFLEHNRRLRRQIEGLEAKVRRRDILVDDQTLCDFYLQRLPESVHSTAALEKWLQGDPKSMPASASARRSSGAHAGSSGTPPAVSQSSPAVPEARSGPGSEADAMEEAGSSLPRACGRDGRAGGADAGGDDDQRDARMGGGVARGESRQPGRRTQWAAERSQYLSMSRADVMRRDTPEITADSHPDLLSIAGNALPLAYRFAPEAIDDGASLRLPLPLLSVTLPTHLAPIPGWREEAVAALLRALPKPVRKYVVPVPEHAALAMARIDRQQDFHAALATWIDDTVRAAGGAQALLGFAGEGGVAAAMIAELPIPEHLRINVQVLDLEGRMLAQGRDLQALKRRLREHEFETAPLSSVLRASPPRAQPGSQPGSLSSSPSSASMSRSSRHAVSPASPSSSQRAARPAPSPETRSAPSAREGQARREQRSAHAAAGRVSRATTGEQGSASATTRAVPGKRTADERVSAAPVSRAPPVNRAAVERTAAEQRYRAWDFGELPASREVERGGLRYTVYPGLIDHGDGVAPAEFAHASPAQGSLRAGILRLAMLALSDQYKYVRGRFAQERELVLLGQGMNTRQPLADALAQQVFADGLLQTGTEGASDTRGDALPRNAEQFQALLDRHRAGLAEVAERMLAQTVQVLRDLRAVRQGLARLNAPGYLPLQQDVQAQLRQLAPEDFPGGVPALLWPHLPRYMKALARRIEKAAGNVRRDEELFARLTPFTRACEQLEAQARGAPLRAELDRLQWLLQEFRVSLFAQDLRTAAPVSEKRLTDQLERARAELRQESPRSPQRSRT